MKVQTHGYAVLGENLAHVKGQTAVVAVWGQCCTLFPPKGKNAINFPHHTFQYKCVLRETMSSFVHKMIDILPITEHQSLTSCSLEKYHFFL